MPQAEQQQSASNESVQTFLSLDDNQKTAMLGKLSPEAKQALLTGIKTRGTAVKSTSGLPAPSATTSDDADRPPNSVAGGFGRRAWETVKGFLPSFSPTAGADEPSDVKKAGALMPPGTLPLYRAGRGLMTSELEAGKTLVKQVGEKKYGRAALTAIGMSPGSVGTTNTQNKLLDEKRYREAIGSGAFDTLLAIVSAKIGEKTPSRETTLQKLTAATGETGETVKNFDKVLDRISDTVATSSKPKTIGDLQNLVQSTFDAHEVRFNQALDPIRQNQVMPVEIARNIRSRITPNLSKTATGRAEIAVLNKAAREFERPWTYEQLNLERMRRTAGTGNLAQKSSSAASMAMKTDVELAIDKAVADGAKEIVYRDMARANPGSDFTLLKQEESALWKLKDQLEDRIGKLTDRSYAKKGESFGQKVHGGIAGGRHGVHGYISGLQDTIPGPSDIDYANENVRKAFGSSTGAAKARRAAVLTLPITRLTRDPGLNPPPKADDDE